MKKLTLFFSFLSVMASAQISHTALDSICSKIRAAQLETAGYKLTYGGEDCTIFYPEGSFNVLFHNLLGYKATYITFSNREVLMVQENLDFAKVNSIDYESWNNFSVVKLYFEKNTIKSYMHEQGKPNQEFTQDYIDFVIPASKSNTFYDLVNLCYMFKIENKRITKEEALKHTKGFKKLAESNEFDLDAWEEYVSKNPTSLYKSVAMDYINEYNAAEEEKLKVTKNFIDSLCVLYKFKTGLSQSEFRVYNSEASEKIGRKLRGSETLNNKSYSYYYVQYDRYFPSGPFNMVFAADKISKYTYCPLSVKQDNVATQNYYNKVLDKVRATLPQECYEAKMLGGVKYITIQHPDLNIVITYSLNAYNQDGWRLTSYICIEFADLDNP